MSAFSSRDLVVPLIAIRLVRCSLAFLVVWWFVLSVHVPFYEPVIHVTEPVIAAIAPIFAARLVPRLPAVSPRLSVVFPHPTGHELDDLPGALTSPCRRCVAPEQLALGVTKGTLDFIGLNPSVGSDGYSGYKGVVMLLTPMGCVDEHLDFQRPHWRGIPGQHEPQGVTIRPAIRLT
jgi:hypothetical protein